VGTHGLALLPGIILLPHGKEGGGLGRKKRNLGILTESIERNYRLKWGDAAFQKEIHKRIAGKKSLLSFKISFLTGTGEKGEGMEKSKEK